MTSEITYAEVRFKNESEASGTKSEPLAALKEKTSPQGSNFSYSKVLFLSLLTLLLLLAISFVIAFIRKDWTCCPKNWKSFSLNCYFISTEGKNWVESEKNCSGMKAHLLVINSKDEQDFITEKLNKKAAYFMGLSDPEGTRDWQWVDQTPYNKNATFWHRGEPSSPDERCVILNAPVRQWGWNDVPCDNIQMSICKMRKIFL
uniref:C-type lectin domain family 4 member A n=1 Tax=Rousettus aegyptiacus TaxID=9407 RepID=A0A7J8JCM0_ROUAE|nr:C-type lectin domain family 4 member A [Rousettus aegyptiacus]